MKAKTLQFGKAMSAALFVLLLVVVGSKNALAQNLVATLQHGSDISMYYGTNAFVQAHEAAQTGDIITLSSGTFNPTTITKAITLRGAGCCMDSVTGIYPTVFDNTLTANVLGNEHSLVMEGICFNYYFKFDILNNSRFIKCNFNELSYDNSSSLMQNAQFVDCMIGSSNFSNKVSHIQFTNCFVNVWEDDCSEGNHISFTNSIVQVKPYGNVGMGGVLATNSIFYSNSNGWKAALSSCLFSNCVALNSSFFFENQTNTTNTYEVFSNVFESFNGNYGSFDNLIYERFILKSDFATSFLGNDGTEVGIHGGQAPYNPRPNYMVLKQCNVANQSTVDGKLSVEIQVVSEGE